MATSGEQQEETYFFIPFLAFCPLFGSIRRPKITDAISFLIPSSRLPFVWKKEQFAVFNFTFCSVSPSSFLRGDQMPAMNEWMEMMKCVFGGGGGTTFCAKDPPKKTFLISYLFLSKMTISALSSKKEQKVICPSLTILTVCDIRLFEIWNWSQWSALSTTAEKERNGIKIGNSRKFCRICELFSISQKWKMGKCFESLGDDDEMGLIWALMNIERRTEKRKIFTHFITRLISSRIASVSVTKIVSYLIWIFLVAMNRFNFVCFNSIGNRLSEREIITENPFDLHRENTAEKLFVIDIFKPFFCIFIRSQRFDCDAHI